MSWSCVGSSQVNSISVEYIDGLYSYAVILTRNHAEAEDLVQETYIRALKAQQKLRPDSNVKGWLFTILRNIWLNQLRKQQSSPQIVEIDGECNDANYPVEPSRSSYELYVHKIEVQQLQAAIQRLPAEFREIIILREYENLPYQDIANVLDCPIGTVMSRLARARAKLRIIYNKMMQPRTHVA